MSKSSSKTGLNSAARKKKDRQDNRKMMLAGCGLALFMLAIFAFTGPDKDAAPLPQGTASDVTADAQINPLEAYARGVPPMEEIDALIDGPSN